MSVALELLTNLDVNEILRISGFLDQITLNKLIESLKGKNFMKSREIIGSIDALDSRNFIRQISEILPSLNIKSENIPKLIIFLGEIDFRISQGADKKIQILALLGLIIETVK